MAGLSDEIRAQIAADLRNEIIRLNAEAALTGGYQADIPGTPIPMGMSGERLLAQQQAEAINVAQAEAGIPQTQFAVGSATAPAQVQVAVKQPEISQEVKIYAPAAQVKEPEIRAGVISETRFDTQGKPLIVSNVPASAEIIQQSGAEYVKTADDKLILKDAFSKLDQRYQTILTTNGTDAYQKAVDMEYIEIPQGNTTTLVSRSDVASLPTAQQSVLKKGGFDALAQFIEENQQKLKGFTYINPDGSQTIDILTALRSGEQSVIKNLFTQKEIDEATSGKLITSSNPLEILMIAGESLASPAIVQGMAKGYTQVFDMAKTGLSKVIAVASDNELNKAIKGDKGYQDFNKAVEKEVNAGLEGWTQYTDTFALPLLSETDKTIKDWVMEAPDWEKPQRAVASAVVDMVGIIPLSIAATLTSSAAKSALGKDVEATAGVVGLGVGAASWFLTRPSAVVSNPLVEGPYTAAMLIGPGKMKDIVKNVAVKTLPIPQKGTSISALGIDPTDVARVKTPAGVSPAEARQIMEIMEKNSAKLIGTDVLPEIIGKTRDQIKITTSDGIGEGSLLVSGLQRAVPNLTHHASGGEFHTAFLNEINTKGYFTVKAMNEARGAVEFVSPQLAGSFLKENPAIMNQLWSVKDLKELPASIANDLKPGTMTDARNKFYQYAYEGKLETGIYPIVKWYGDKNVLEYELMVTPDFKWYALESPWYAKKTGVNTATTFTTSPISLPTAGLKEGQKVPLYWVVSEKAMAEGRKMPSLNELYKAEVYSTITDLRKMLPQNIKLRDITTDKGEPATSSLIGSRLKAVELKGPEWANDPKQVIARVNSGQLQPYYRQRATAIVLDQDGKVVMVQERNGNWSLPGGKIEGGKTSIATILRELQEETGIKETYRWERVGTIKDKTPLVTDAGEMLWSDGKPVYNEHHVYLVKISREDSPRASHEIKSARKIDYDKATKFRKKEAFVSSVLKMVDEQKIRDFVDGFSGKEITTEQISKAKATGEWNKTKIDTSYDEGKPLPYRLEVEPRIRGVDEMPVSKKEVETGIFTTYAASLPLTEKTTEPYRETTSTLITEPRVTTGEKKPEQVIGEQRTIPETEVTPEIPTTPSIPESPIVPSIPETTPTPYNPPEMLEVPTIPITPITTTTIQTDDGTVTLTGRQIMGAVAWKQGFIYKAWVPPYTQKDIINTRKPIPGVKYFEGPGSAAKSIVALFGEIPPFLYAHMGIVDIGVKGQGAAQPTLTFKSAPKRSKKPKRDSWGEIRFTR